MVFPDVSCIFCHAGAYRIVTDVIIFLVNSVFAKLRKFSFPIIIWIRILVVAVLRVKAIRRAHIFLSISVFFNLSYGFPERLE